MHCHSQSHLLCPKSRAGKYTLSMMRPKKYMDARKVQELGPTIGFATTTPSFMLWCRSLGSICKTSIIIAPTSWGSFWKIKWVSSCKPFRTKFKCRKWWIGINIVTNFIYPPITIHASWRIFGVLATGVAMEGLSLLHRLARHQPLSTSRRAQRSVTFWKKTQITHL